MADTVRYLMEEMIPELEDFERKGYFSRQEVKAIVKRRQDFEYLLKRRAALKQDFLRAIDYETKLEQLRRHRKRSLSIRGKKSVSDYSIVRRIHFIYERALRKFKSDFQLWWEWIDFCKSTKSSKQLSKVITKALQRHSTVAALWLEASAWEFEHNRNVAAARALMQQGLRVCRHDEGLWAEYFRMELTYVAKLRLRRKVLGIEDADEAAPVPASVHAAAAAAVKDSGGGGKRRKLNSGKRGGGGGDEQPSSSGSSSGSESGDEDERTGRGEDDLFKAARAAPGIVVGTDEERASAQRAVDDTEQAVRAVLSGAVAAIVFRSAVAAVPRSVAFRRRFLDVLRAFDFPGIPELTQQVYDSIERDFPVDEDAWDLRARRHYSPAASNGSKDAAAGQDGDNKREREEVDDGGKPPSPSVSDLAAACASPGLKQALAAYGQALKAVPSARMHQLFCAFQADHVAPLLAAVERGAPGCDALLEPLSASGAQLLASYHAAHDAGLASEPLYLAWAHWSGRLSQTKMALKALRAACERTPGSGPVWQARLRLEHQQLQQPAGKTQQRRKGGIQQASAAAATASAKAAAAAAAAELLPLIKTAVTSVKGDQALPLWLLALDMLPPGTAEFARLEQLLLTQLAGSAKGPCAGGMGTVAAAFVKRVRGGSGGLEAARGLNRQLLKLPPAGGDFFRHAIELEKECAAAAAAAAAAAGQTAASAAAGSSGGSSAVRQLYEAAVAAYGDVDAELWVDYALWEQQGAVKGVGSVYWRATKALADPDPFIERFRKLQSQQCKAADDA